jgi:hypothetical protein
VGLLLSTGALVCVLLLPWHVIRYSAAGLRFLTVACATARLLRVAAPALPILTVVPSLTLYRLHATQPIHTGSSGHHVPSGGSVHSAAKSLRSAGTLGSPSGRAGSNPSSAATKPGEYSLWVGCWLCGAAWCCVVLCGAVWCCVVLCGAVWCCVVLCGAVWCCLVLCGAVWCCAVLAEWCCAVMWTVRVWLQSAPPGEFEAARSLP